jgi:RNA polymerase sigma factor (sigma-70 family)
VDEGEQAFGPWYAIHAAALVRAVAVGCGDAEVASEAVADACARAYLRWSEVGAMDNPAGWAYVAASRLARRRVARQRRLQPWQARHDRAVDAPSDDGVDVRRAVARMPERMRTAVALRYLLDLSEADVAAAMGLTRGGVSSLLVKARKRLAEDGALR